MEKNNKKYYLMTYLWKSKTDKNYNIENAVRDYNPLKEVKEWNQDKIKYPETYKLLFYKEITKEEYDMVNGWVE